VVEGVERSLAVGNVQLECFAGFGVVDLDRDVAIVGVPEQANLNAAGAETVEFSRQRCGCWMGGSRSSGLG
jgi:hypothetical protein